MGYLASVLGPPRGWIADAETPDSVPNYWIYNHLEFSFRQNETGQLACDWFQFDAVMLTKSNSIKEAGDFYVWLGKLGAKSKPSDFLKALQLTQDVSVQLVNDARGAGAVIRVSDSVKIIFDHDMSDDEFRCLDPAERIAVVEREAYCHCITSSIPNETVEVYDTKMHGKERVTLAEYLQMIHTRRA